MGFIPHEDHLHGFYTCRWYMTHYTCLVGLEDNFTNAKLCMDLLLELGMAAHADTRVGDEFYSGLNRGQKRRLSVALEALSNPETLFCDEPTTGLDSESAYQIMRFLRSYASAPGRRVVVTLHEPSSLLWQYIDNVVLLSEGKLVYQGPKAEMGSFFSLNDCPCPPRCNPADHYVASVSAGFQLNDKSADDWANAYHGWEKTGGISSDIELAVASTQNFPPSPLSGKKLLLGGSSKPRLNSIVTTIRPKPSSRANIARAMVELIRRYAWSMWLNPGFIGLRAVLYSASSLLLGILFWNLESRNSYASAQSRAALLFYIVVFYVFLSIVSVPFAFFERGRIEKEVRNGYYHPAAFHVAQGLISILGVGFLALISTVIIIAMMTLHSPIVFFFNLLLTLICAEGLNQLMTYLLPNFIIATGVLSGVYAFSALLQGFMIIPSEFPSWLAWSHYIAFHTYSWQSFMAAEFGVEYGEQADRLFTTDGEFGMTGKQVLEEYEINHVRPMTNMIILGSYALAINLISLAVLHIKHVSHKSHQVGMDG